MIQLRHVLTTKSIKIKTRYNMEFFFGMLFGALMALMLFSSPSLSNSQKRSILEVVALLDRHVDFLEAEERAGNVTYKGTRLEKDVRKLEERVDKENTEK